MSCTLYGGVGPCSAAAAEAEVERLTAALADRDRHIEAVLAYCDELKPISFAWHIQRILRGESDE